ncbi:hypothetical protein [Streptomyces megasporus]|uniref:hypothetical protein n=1 Tax=Streptomyces megasporus TaxID=44060 RepID=UPI0004E27CA1|nr:hypothetical protein [Streptomyces megasporus]
MKITFRRIQKGESGKNTSQAVHVPRYPVTASPDSGNSIVHARRTPSGDRPLTRRPSVFPWESVTEYVAVPREVVGSARTTHHVRMGSSTDRTVKTNGL